MASIQGRPKAPRHESMIDRALQNGEYQVEAVLGHGGMGQVFLASYATLDIPVALKQVRGDQPLPESVTEELDRILHSKDGIPLTSSDRSLENDFPVSGGANTDRFLREALLLARLHHPSLPTLYDYFFEEGYWYLVMEYIPGPTLAAYIRQHAPLPPLEAMNYAMQLCDVLDYFHKQSPPVIFRDLKPSNVILNPDGRLMLVDFGIARYFKTGQVNDTTDFGSPGYASPEQYQGIGQTDGRSDLFSLGVILHEMISGQRPVGIGGKLELLRQINPAISPVLSALVNVAVRPEPMYRFQTAHTFYQALERVHVIEERRAYQHQILLANQVRQKLSSQGEENRTPAQEPPVDIRNDEAIPASPSSLQKTQRLHGRESLNEARREQLEKEALEIQLASVDEGLRQRSLSGIISAPRPIVPTPLPYTTSPPPNLLTEEENKRASHPVHRTRRIVHTSFVLALVLVLVLASLFSYSRLYHPSQSTSQGQESFVTPIVVPTAGSSWQVLPSIPSPEADNTAIYVQLQGKAYIYMNGGYRGPENAPHYDRSLYRYDLESAHWERVASKNFPGMVNNAVALDEQNNLFYTVGYSSDTYTATSLLYMYQPADGKLQKIVPPPQTPVGFGAAMLADQQGHLYISEGFMKAGNPHELAGSGWYRYDITSGQWHLLAPLPVGLGYAVLASDGRGGILVLSGAKDAGQHLPVSQIYRYDIQQNVWVQEQADAPSAFSSAASCLDGYGHIVIVGGYDGIHEVTLRQTWLVDLQTLRWQALALLPLGGSLLGAAACDGKGHIFLVRGANDPNRPTADFWELSTRLS